jgi:hypothetical protein
VPPALVARPAPEPAPGSDESRSRGRRGPLTRPPAASGRSPACGCIFTAGSWECLGYRRPAASGGGARGRHKGAKPVPGSHGVATLRRAALVTSPFARVLPGVHLLGPGVAGSGDLPDSWSGPRLMPRPVPHRPAARRRVAEHRHMPRWCAWRAGSLRRAAVTHHPRHDDPAGTPLMPVAAAFRVTPPAGPPHAHHTIRTRVRNDSVS